MVPIKIEGRNLLVAITDPMDISRLHALELAVGLHVKPVLAKEKDITARIEALFGNSYSTEANTGSAAREIEGAVETANRIGDRRRESCLGCPYRAL